jgi:DNA-binding CsgD family transcriptional regulator
VLLWNGRAVVITQHCLIGRAPSNDLVLADAEVSPRHAMLFHREERWWINDLGSRHGVHINGLKLTQVRCLSDGDELRIGAHKLIFQSAPRPPGSRVTRIAARPQAAENGHGEPSPKAVLCELIVADAEGEIYQGDKAARWFFKKSAQHRLEAADAFLPEAVHDWLKRLQAGGGAGGEPLELLEVDRRVLVTLCRCDAGRCFLLVREESVQMAPQRLRSLGLTERQAEVMHWVGEGKTNPEIALILSVTVHTVNRHLERIFTKLGVDNRQKAIVTVLERLSGV